MAQGDDFTRANFDTEAQRTRDAIDALNAQSRILLEARMLPRDQTLTDEQLDGVRQSFVAYLKANGLNYSRVADPIGYSSSTLSEWVAGKYSGDESAVARKINDWQERDARRRKAKTPAGYIPTRVAEEMRMVINQADKTGLMAAIVAPSGCGKTFVLHSLADTLNAIYIRCDDACTPLGLLRRIAKALGHKNADHSTRSALQDFCVEKLAAKKHAIFLDEAHLLSTQTMSLVRTLHDPPSGATVIMVGTVAILESINDRKDGRGQFSRRCLRYNLMDYVRHVGNPRGGGSAGDRDLFSIEEVKAFFDMKRIRLKRDALEMVWLIACLPNYGTLGFAEKLVSIAQDLTGDDEAIDRPTLMSAARIFMGDEFQYVHTLAHAHLEASSAAHQQEAAVSA